MNNGTNFFGNEIRNSQIAFFVFKDKNEMMKKFARLGVIHTLRLNYKSIE